MKPIRALFLGLLLALPLVATQAQSPDPIPQERLFTYLDRLTQWQRDAVAIQPSSAYARETVFQDSVRDNATSVLRAGFDFIRSIGRMQLEAGQINPESTHAKLALSVKETQQRIGAMQSRMASSSGPARQQLAEMIQVEQARLGLIQTILANLNSASSKSPNKLLYTVESLARSIPELQSRTAAPVSRVTEPETDESGAKGILGLGSDIFEIARKQRELTALIVQTSALKDESMVLMKQLRSGLGEAPSDGEQETAEEATPAPVLTASERVQRYKQLGNHIVPLADTMQWIDATRQTLHEWYQVLDYQFDRLLKLLGIQLAILLVSLAIPWVLSELAERAIDRIPDKKRGRQLNTARRILVSIAFILILLLNFISDFSSFATFAGFLTAGLAVALQSVLLSLVAHFLFYGRYGVRNGDRVHVAGVTGDIVQIGMVRFYLRELKESGEGLEPTGNIVAFPNSILFQSVAFYKHVSR